MKISVCIPTFGRAKMLVQALHSILIQEHEDYEVIVRDDDPEHPVGNDTQFCYTQQYFGDRLKYVIEPHIGAFSAVMNATLRHATGDILHIMGSDDLMCPSALYAVNEAFESFRDTDRFGGSCWLYGKTISVDSHLRFQGSDGAPTSLEALRKKNCIGLPSTFWNRQMMILAGTFDTRYKRCGDYDLWLRFWVRRDPVFLNQELGIYRHHDDNMSLVHRQETEDEAQRISQRHSCMNDSIMRARNAFLEKRAYNSESNPVSHDG